MAKQNKYNLNSPNSIKNKINIENPESWLFEEIRIMDSDENYLDENIKNIFKIIIEKLDTFCRFPQESILLWNGCNRIPENDKRQKYHKYPEELKIITKEKRINLDTRANGPAIASFEFSGGTRPKRFGSNNAWSIHHLYSGKFIYPFKNEKTTTHAIKCGLHFTQSAGLIAVHPILDSLCDEIPAITWYLRYLSFLKFSYDPDKVFCNQIDEYGFDSNKKNKMKIIFNKDGKGN